MQLFAKMIETGSILQQSLLTFLLAGNTGQMVAVEEATRRRRKRRRKRGGGDEADIKPNKRSPDRYTTRVMSTWLF